MWSSGMMGLTTPKSQQNAAFFVAGKSLVYGVVWAQEG